MVNDKRNKISSMLEFENESSYLDFKAIEYKKTEEDKLEKKDPFSELLKDVIAMANADIQGDRYILTGVKILKDGSKNLIGIRDLTDSAIYEQLILENIEPAVTIKYEGFAYNEVIFGLLTISDCIDQPYCMKKSYGKLQKGDSFIRRGSTQMKCNRSDFDRMYSGKLDKTYFNEEVDLAFFESRTNELTINTVDEIVMPSDIAVDLMRKVLKFRQDNNGYTFSMTKVQELLPNGAMGYYMKSGTELEMDIKNAKQDLMMQDKHYLYETVSIKVSLEISNKGSEYLQDVSFEMYVPVVNGLEIADKIHHKHNFDMIAFNFPGKNIYPAVHKHESVYKIVEHVGDVKHHIPVTIFQVPLRIFVAPVLKGHPIKLSCKIFAKNLKNPLDRELTINIQ